MPAVTENGQSSPNEETEYPLENYVGDVYIGSPQRRRHYLEPLNVCKKTPSPKGKDRKKTVCNYFFHLSILLKYNDIQGHSELLGKTNTKRKKS